MKKISIVVPTYNEEGNVKPMAEALEKELIENLDKYDYEIIFIDNCSTDDTRIRLEEICKTHKRIKAIFNVKNFGQFNSPFYGLLQSTGDCAILVCADFQDPLDMLPKFVEEWESGYQIVCGIKTTSKENHILYKLRTFYYDLLKKMSPIEQIEHFTGFGLYDKSFISVLRALDDPMPFLRGLVAEFGGKRKDIPYEQQKRKSGKTHNNFYTLYDGAMLSFTTYTKIGLRIASFFGFIIAGICVIIALVMLVLKIVYWDRYVAGMAPIILSVLFLGAVQLLFIGFLGEYVMSINNRVQRHPLVVEEKRLNFDNDINDKEKNKK